MPESDKRKKGREMFEEVMRFKPPEMSEPFLDVTIDHLFADLWSRPGLPVRERRLITLTVIACLGHEPTLRLHLGAAMKGEFSDEEVDEIVLHITHYAGWPVGAVASGVVRQLRAERAEQA